MFREAECLCDYGEHMSAGKLRKCSVETTRTAASVSAIIFRDFSLSRLSCAARAISDARKRRFSTYRVDICALSSSMRTLSVELSL